MYLLCWLSFMLRSRACEVNFSLPDNCNKSKNNTKPFQQHTATQELEAVPDKMENGCPQISSILAQLNLHS